MLLVRLPVSIMALQTRCYALLHNSDLHAPADIGLDTGRLQKEAGERKKKTTPMP